MTTPKQPEGARQVRVWQIGPDGTEYYSAHSEEEMKQYYREMCGPEDHVEEDLRDYFEEVLDLDAVEPNVPPYLRTIEEEIYAEEKLHSRRKTLPGAKGGR